MTTLRRKLLQGSGLLLGGQVIAQALAFGRNIIVARILSPEDFGIASMLVLLVTVLDMLSNLSVDRLLVQAPDGDEPAFLASAHGLQLFRGILIAIAIFVIADPVARLFKVPEARWAFQCLALVPAIRALAHLDRKRLHREMCFKGDVISETVPQAVALVLAWPLTYYLRSYSAILWILVAQAIALTVASLAVAKRPYQLSWHKEYVSRLMAFGWPLAVNGLLMSAIFQGDKFVIGSTYGPRDLGIYTVAFGLAMLPVLSAARVNGSLLLPLLSSRQSDALSFRKVLRNSSGLTSLCACLLAAGFVTCGPILLVLIYGEAYSAAGSVIGWLGIMQSIRLMRDVHSQAAMALGESKNPMYANLLRNVALLGMLVVAVYRLPLVWLAVVGTAGELAAMLLASQLLHRQHGLDWSTTLGYPLRALSCIAACLAFTTLTGADRTLPGALSAFAIAGAVSLTAFCGVAVASLRAPGAPESHGAGNAPEGEEMIN